MIGNVLFFKRTNTFISRVIAKITNGEYTHVGLIVAYDEMTGVATIIESDRFVETRISRIMLTESHMVYGVQDLDEDVRSKIVKFAFDSIGTKYDYSQIIGLFISLLFKGNRFAFFNTANRLICSELIDLAYYKSGVNRLNPYNIGYITPQELLQVYELKDVRKGV